MKDFTAELEQVFGVAPSQETGLLIDTFDDAGMGDSVGRASFSAVTWTRVASCGGNTRVAASICRASARPSVSPCRVANTGVCRVAVPA